jgi:hypothetical protein
LTKWLIEIVSPLPHTSLIGTTLQISRESIEVKIKKQYKWDLRLLCILCKENINKFTKSRSVYSSNVRGGVSDVFEGQWRRW